MVTRVLILAGTSEARALAARLSVETGFHVIASLAGVTTSPEHYPVEIRTGGFGGADGLARWMREADISALINATHPYATKMQDNVATASAASGIPNVRLLRPAWQIRPEWSVVTDLEAAAAALPAGSRTLLTTGQKDIAPFARRSECSMVLRTIEPPGDLPPHIQAMTARPPFSFDQECATLGLLGITHLVSKNAGGTGTSKLDAAGSLRLKIIMVDRPPLPSGPIVETVEDAVAWLIRTVAN